MFFLCVLLRVAASSIRIVFNGHIGLPYVLRSVARVMRHKKPATLARTSIFKISDYPAILHHSNLRVNRYFKKHYLLRRLDSATN